MRVPVMEQGIAALEEIDERLGLAFDDWDKQYYYNLFACASTSGSFSTKMPARSPRKLFMFIIPKKNLFWIKVSKNHVVSF